MHPSTTTTTTAAATNTTSDLNVPTTTLMPSPASPMNRLSSNAHSNSFLVLNSSTNGPHRYAAVPDFGSAPSNYLDLLRTWNYHSFLTSTIKVAPLSDDSPIDCHARNGSFHECFPRPLPTSRYPLTDDEIQLRKFHHNTLVALDTGEMKNIQQLTTNDFLASAKQNGQYSSLLARIEYIGPVDSATGKAELRFFIDDIEKMTSYSVLQEMPFFVQQHSCWSSVSPTFTHRLCGLKCRQLACGDIIIAITEQRVVSSSTVKLNGRPDYKQQSPSKALASRYINGGISSSNKRHKVSNE